jgi:hypothetical protein
VGGWSQSQFSTKTATMSDTVTCLAYDFCLHGRWYLLVILAFCYSSLWISSFPPPRPVTTGNYTGRMGTKSTHTCNRLNTPIFPLYDYPAKMTNWARLQFSQDSFGDPINLDSEALVDSPQTIKKRRMKPKPEMQKDVMINVTNEFLASPSSHCHNVTDSWCCAHEQGLIHGAVAATCR